MFWDDKNLTPLHYAVLEGELEKAQELLSGAEDIDALGTQGRTPLLYAIREGHEDIAIALLEKGADIHASDDNGRNAIAIAITMRPYYSRSKIIEIDRVSQDARGP